MNIDFPLILVILVFGSGFIWLLDVLVAPGDSVSKGQVLAVLEAMKMHYEIVAEIDGTVAEVSAVTGSQVAADDLLIEINQPEEAA